MLRNGFGSMSMAESITVIVELFVLGTVVLQIAVPLFRYGSIEYTRKVSLKTAFQRQRRVAPAPR
jgi:ABC-2 type transport system permease protein